MPVLFAALLATGASWLYVAQTSAPFTNVNSTNFTPGSSQVINCGNVLDWNGATPRTMGGWGRLAVSAPAGALISKGNGSTGYDLFYNGGLLYFYAPSAGGGLLYLGGTVTPPDGTTWHRYTFTSDGSKTAAGTVFYEDGVALTKSINADTLTGSLSNAGNFLLGDDGPFGPDPFKGRFDEVYVWDIALSAGQEAQLGSGGHAANLTALAFSADLLFWSRMGDPPDSTSTYFDASTGGHNCTPTNITGGDIGPPVP